MRVYCRSVLGALALAAVFLAFPTSAGAEEETPPEGVVDVAWHLSPLERGLQELSDAPRDGGLDGAVEKAWRENLKRRVGRMQRRVKDLGKKSWWVKEEEGERIRGLEPGKWSPFVRGLAALHTELGTCEEGYGNTRVGPERAMRRWRKAHPGPLPIGIVPSRAALAEIEAAILDYQLRNLAVPPRLWAAQRRLRLQVQEEEEQARAERRREYEAAKAEARAAIEEDVAATNERLEDVATFLRTGQRNLRALLATAQQVEEYRLRRRLEDVTLDETQRADAEKLFEKMAKGRAKSLGFSEKHLSRYGAGVQQGWMVPRAKLRKLVDKAKASAEIENENEK